MVASIGASVPQSPVTQVLKKQEQRNDEVRELEAERLERQAKIQEELRLDQKEKAQNIEERRGQSVDVRV